MAANAARQPAAKLATKKMAARNSELSSADFQFQRRINKAAGLRMSARSTSATETNSQLAVSTFKPHNTAGKLARW